MSIIDIHAHAFPQAIAARAISKLESAGHWKAIGDGTVNGLIKSMDEANIDLSVICPIATKPDQVEGIVAWCNEIRNDRIEPFASVHPDTPDAGGWVARFAREGFLGVKLHPMYQNFHTDEARLDPIYAALQEHGLALAMHCGRDIAFHEDDDRAAPIRFRRIIDKFPRLKLICTHLGGWESWDESVEHLVGQNVFLETSFSLTRLGPQRAVELIRKHGADRVMFGSDWPWQSQKEDVVILKRTGLTQQELEKILWGNAATLLKL